MTKTKKIFICCTGCNRRKFDAVKLINYFKLNNWKIEKTPKKADYIIFVSCAFWQVPQKLDTQYVFVVS